MANLGSRSSGVPTVKKNKSYGAPRLERYGAIAELSAGGSGSMQEGTGFVGQASGGAAAGSMSGPGIGMRDSRP